jgi:hypothetical protein
MRTLKEPEALGYPCHAPVALPHHLRGLVDREARQVAPHAPRFLLGSPDAPRYAL